MSSTQIKCPNCGSYKTHPVELGNQASKKPGVLESELSGLKSFLGDLFGIREASELPSFNNMKFIELYNSGRIGAYCAICGFRFDKSSVPKETAKQQNASGSIESRLAELDNLKSKGIVTEEEYRRKREEILRSL